MQTFTVHEPPEPPSDRIDRAERLTFVRDGFSWTAAVFAPVWLLAHRLWWALLAYLAVIAGLQVLNSQTRLDPDWLMIAGIALNLLVGFEADTLRRWGLDRRGWQTLGSVTGKNMGECERRFFDEWLVSQPVLAARPRDTASPTLGTRLRRPWGALFGSRL
jgi:hypothetical protein